MNLLCLYILAILWTTECVLVHAQQLSRSQKAQSASSYVRNCLAEGQYLATGEYLESSSGLYRAVYQTDGDLATYDYTSGSPVEYWSLGYGSSSPNQLIMQSNGKLVAYTSSYTAYWSPSATFNGVTGYSGVYLMIQDNRNLALYSSDPNGLPTYGNNSIWECSYNLDESYNTVTHEQNIQQCSILSGTDTPDCYCQVGYHLSNGTGVCTACPAGQYQPSVGQYSCIKCQSNSYQSNIGQSSCSTCPAEETQSPDATECVPIFSPTIEPTTQPTSPRTTQTTWDIATDYVEGYTNDYSPWSYCDPCGEWIPGDLYSPSGYGPVAPGRWECSEQSGGSGFIYRNIASESSLDIGPGQISMEVDYGDVSVLWTAPYSSNFSMTLSIGGSKVYQNGGTGNNPEGINSAKLVIGGQSFASSYDSSSNILTLQVSSVYMSAQESAILSMTGGFANSGNTQVQWSISCLECYVVTSPMSICGMPTPSPTSPPTLGPNLRPSISPSGVPFAPTYPVTWNLASDYQDGYTNTFDTSPWTYCSPCGEWVGDTLYSPNGYGPVADGYWSCGNGGFVYKNTAPDTELGIESGEVSMEVDYGDVSVLWTAPYSSNFTMTINIGGSQSYINGGWGNNPQGITSATLLIRGVSYTSSSYVSNVLTFEVAKVYIPIGGSAVLSMTGGFAYAGNTQVKWSIGCITCLSVASPQSICQAPTQSPTMKPTITKLPSVSPSSNPTFTPTKLPTIIPTIIPSLHPSKVPSNKPSTNPTTIPSDKPSTNPTTIPSDKPSTNPTTIPSNKPSTNPTTIPSNKPSTNPTTIPSLLPSSSPIISPTDYPSVSTSMNPISGVNETPSEMPSTEPNMLTTDEPSVAPSIYPTLHPSKTPSTIPFHTSSRSPGFVSTSAPSIISTATPTVVSSLQPSVVVKSNSGGSLTSSLSTGALVGIIVGGVFVCLFIVLVTGFYYLGRQKTAFDREKQEFEIERWVSTSPKEAELDIVVNVNNPLKKEATAIPISVL